MPLIALPLPLAGKTTAGPANVDVTEVVQVTPVSAAGTLSVKVAPVTAPGPSLVIPMT